MIVNTLVISPIFVIVLVVLSAMVVLDMVVIVCIIELSEYWHWPVIVVAGSVRLVNLGSFTFLFTVACRGWKNGNVPKFGWQGVGFFGGYFEVLMSIWYCQHWLHITSDCEKTLNNLLCKSCNNK